MVVDSSAVVAILEEEPDGGELLRRLVEASARRISATTLLETAIVLEAKSGEAAGDHLDLFLARGGVVVEEVTAEQIQIARKAWRKFGKGSGHPAGLNYGDCFSYALAKAFGEELLFKGGDFGKTDVNR